MLDDCLSLARDGCNQLYEQQRETLVDKYEAVREDYE
jgi:hypothetical protein